MSIGEFEVVVPALDQRRIPIALGDGNSVDVGLMVQVFEDRIWVCVTEDGNVKPGVVAVGVPDVSRAGMPSGPSPGAMLGSQIDANPTGDSDIMLSCDEVTIVLGPRDDPFANILVNQIFQFIGAAFQGTRGMVACISLRQTAKALTTPTAKRDALDGILNGCMTALCGE